MSLDFYGFIDGDFPVEECMIIRGSNQKVGGDLVFTETSRSFHIANHQPETRQTKQFLDQGGERFEEIRNFYINDGLDVSLAERFQIRPINDGRLFKPLLVDCRPWRNYCKITAGAIPDSFIDFGDNPFNTGDVVLTDRTIEGTST